MNKKTFTIHEEAIVTLVDSMMHGNHAFSCTSRSALNYCHQLITRFDSLDKDSLQEIIESTLQHQEITIADIFCEYMPRP